MPLKKDEKDLPLKITEIFKVGPKPIPSNNKDWDFLVYELKKMKVTPAEAYRIVAQKKGDTDIRFNWKMIRLSMYVWERIEEDKGMYLKPKIDTVRSVVTKRKFEQFFHGYYPDLHFDHEKEVKLLNKLIAEKSVRPYFKEGYYFYEGTKRLIPQKVLDHILWGKK
ncbi:hypothetical protein OAU78_03665 [Candidatus Pelagibacter sp.]|jgi:hypothetical protein|nr:hypothetical protein [Candidatus Pelagibacter sp.]|tara:strand:+ start:119 stop:616 length:498 start_codon:yes stop_codon:yes gene_type:complete